MEKQETNNEKTLSQRISEGLQRSFEKLVIEKAKDDGELIFCRDGKIVRVKAKELLKQQTK